METGITTNDIDAHYSNRRRETRARSRGVVDLIIGNDSPIPGRIYDVSVNGMSVDAPTEIIPGTPVCIEGMGFFGRAIVRRCISQNDSFRIGMELLPPE